MKSKKQLKEELHQLIDSIDDEQVLQTLNEDIVPYVASKDAESLTAEQQQELEEAIAAADKGETVSFDEFKASMDKWRTAYKSTGASK
jgi:predicted transcriptional regulator